LTRMLGRGAKASERKSEKMMWNLAG